MDKSPAGREYWPITHVTKELSPEYVKDCIKDLASERNSPSELWAKDSTTEDQPPAWWELPGSHLNHRRTCACFHVTTCVVNGGGAPGMSSCEGSIWTFAGWRDCFHKRSFPAGREASVSGGTAALPERTRAEMSQGMCPSFRRRRGGARLPCPCPQLCRGVRTGMPC